MNSLRTTITQHHLHAALSDITSMNRHWFSLPRPGAAMLQTLVSEHGHNVFLYELPPEWEHVIAPQVEPLNDLRKIAAERAKLRAQGVPEHALPL